MSHTYYAEYICGFKVTISDVFKPVTKYNEDTGEPYTRQIQDHKVLVIDQDPSITFKEAEDDEFCSGEKIEGLEINKLEVYANDYIAFLGIIIRIHEGSVYCAIDPEVPEAVNIFAKKYNLKPEYYSALN